MGRLGEGEVFDGAVSPVTDSSADSRNFCIEVEDEGERLDRFLARASSDLSRSRLQSLIKSGHVEVNAEVVKKPRHSLASGDRIRIEIPPPDSVELLPEDIPLSVLFEDDYLIVVDKPAGLVVHPGAGNAGGTLVNALLYHCGGQLSRAGDSDRPGIVHRLDKETSGCLVAAKNDDAYLDLVRQFSGREVGKTYRCVVQGVPDPPEGHIENRIGRHPVSRQRMAVLEEPAGKLAITDYEVLNSASDGSWSAIRCEIHTGRTHQIRVHMKETLKSPILGDEIYAQPKRQLVKTSRMLLHAWKLAFENPATGERIAFESTLPEPFDPFTER